MARGRVCCADDTACSAGVLPGMRRASALACLPGLEVLARQPEAEQRALIALAHWAGRWTPRVALHADQDAAQGLILEIGASLRLFGGLDALLAQVRQGLLQLDHRSQLAVAPTALGAWWLALGSTAGPGQEPVCRDMAALHQALDDLSLTLPPWPEPVRQRLQQAGLETLGQLGTLPAPAVRERLGAAPWQQLCQARGEWPDEPRWYVFPPCFSQDLELPWKVADSLALRFPVRHLLAALLGWLEQQEQLLVRARLDLHHAHAGAGTPDASRSTLLLAPAEPSRDLNRLMDLLEEKLARLPWPGPVLALSLQLEESCPAEHSQHLWGAAAGAGALACLERLAARLGESGLHGLGLVPEHRPELAWRRRPLAELIPAFKDGAAAFVAPETERTAPPPAAASPTQQRPAWLLPEPLALVETRAGLRCRNGPLAGRLLQLLSPAERIESGWWDVEGAGDVRRDYFVAGCASGERAWVFRNREGWFLHGLFA